MATRTFAQLESTLQAFVRMWEEGRLFAESNSPNVLSMASNLIQTFDATDFPDQYAAGINELRGALSAYLAGGDQFLIAWLQEYMRFLDRAFVSTQDALEKVYDDFIDNGRRVKSRAFSYGSPSAAATNVGDGVLLRLTDDANGIGIESLVPEAKTAICEVDSDSGGTRNQEQFELRGATAARDLLESLGSGAVANLRAVYPSRDSLIQNASFDGRSGDNSNPTAITNWSSTVAIGGTNQSLSETITYLPPLNDALTVRSLALKTNQTLAQKLSVGGRQLDSLTPYYTGLPYNASAGSASGSITLRIGTQSNTVAVTGATVGWNVLSVPGTPGQNSWFENFNTNDLSVAIKWSGSGSIVIDDLWLVPFDRTFDDTGYVMRPGPLSFRTRHPANSDGDRFDWTDSIASDSVIQRWLQRRANAYLPHSATPTVVDP